jgi:uncharacterized membrane protein
MSWRKELKNGLSLLFLLSRAHQVFMNHSIDHPGSCQQRVVTPSSQFANFMNFTFCSLWVALGKERTRNIISILDDHKSSKSSHVINWEIYGHPNHWILTYDGHINKNLCGDLSTLVVVCFLGKISIVANLWCLDQDIGWTPLDS